MSGPPKLPSHLKLLRGTLDASSRNAPDTPALPAIDAVPSPPAWLTKTESLREWNRLAPMMVANGMLNAGNVTLLAHLCAVHGHLVALWRRGGKPNATFVATYRALSNSLGLLSMNVPPAQAGNRFARNANRAKLPTGCK